MASDAEAADQRFVEEVCQEYAQAGMGQQDEHLAVLSRAIFLEDVFDVTLSDEQLAPGRLVDMDEVRAIVAGRRTA